MVEPLSILSNWAIDRNVGVSMGNHELIGDSLILSQEAGGVVLWSRRVHRDVEDMTPSIEEGPIKDF